MCVSSSGIVSLGTLVFGQKHPSTQLHEAQEYKFRPLDVGVECHASHGLLQNEQIFRLLLKISVQGFNVCGTISNFWAPFLLTARRFCAISV